MDMLEKGGECAFWGVDAGEFLRRLVYEAYVLQSVESFIGRVSTITSQQSRWNV